MIAAPAVATLAAAIALPHLLALERVSPVRAIACWLVALTMRALAVLLAVTLLVVDLPDTTLFARATRWCWHAVLPIVAAHLGFSGHSLGAAAAVIPAIIVSVSVGWVAWGLLRAGAAVRTLLRQRGLGRGPAESLIVGGPNVLVAAAGFARPRVVVSAGALTALEDAELAASLAHERGHIARGHRFILLFGQLCRALSPGLPGGPTALRQLAMHIERDADAFALAERHDPTALASAICKAAACGYPAGMVGFGDGRPEARRIRLGIGEGRRGCRGPRRALAATMSVSVAVVLALTIAAGSAAAVTRSPLARATTGYPCPS